MTADKREKSSLASDGISESRGGVSLMVRVAPKASRSRVEGMVDGALKVRVAAPPVDGEANEELIKILAKFFKTPKTAVTIASGGSSRTKRVVISRLALDEARRILAALA